jgi:hypothetical protein
MEQIRGAIESGTFAAAYRAFNERYRVANKPA